MIEVFAQPIKRSNEEIIYEAPEKSNELFDDLIRAKCDTMDTAWKWAVNRYKSRDLLGTRDILAHEDEVQSNGKIFKKFQLGDYRWISYEGAETTADYFGRGLRSIGLKPKEKICVFADTRNEWFLSAVACFKHGFPLVTLYTNLGEEAVIHGVNQTQVTHIITSHDLLPKFKGILQHTPTVKKVVFIEDQVQSTDTTGYREGVDIMPFWSVVSAGKKLETDPEFNPIPPTPCLLYTSPSPRD